MIEVSIDNLDLSKSTLIIDNLENESSLLLFALINKLCSKDNYLVDLYPSYFRTQFQLEKYFSNRIVEHDLFIDKFFSSNKSDSDSCFHKILNDVDKKKTKDESTKKRKNFLIFDNLNLVLKRFESNPFKLIHFIIELNKRSDSTGLLMVIHEDCVDETILNQLKSFFYTNIYIKSIKTAVGSTVGLSSTSNHGNIYKYELEINDKNPKTAKMKTHNQTVYLNEEFDIIKLEKEIKNLKSTTKINEEKHDDDPLKGLTFNVYLSSDDLEAKKNLVLPYELIGQNKSVQPVKQEEEKNKGMIYYAPDERDDVDDEDPDDDLNF